MDNLQTTPQIDTLTLPIGLETGFAIVCLQCGNRHAAIWARSLDGEYDGNTIKCGKCGQKEDL